jgi:hypothetical protein
MSNHLDLKHNITQTLSSKLAAQLALDLLICLLGANALVSHLIVSLEETVLA